MENLTLLDKITKFLDSKQFERGLYFVCFVVAPAYIVGHIVAFIIRGV